MTAILRYDAACTAIAEAKTVDEVTEWIDKAAAVREYTRRIGNRQLEIDAIEIRVRARKRRGELLLGFRATGQLRDGKKRKQSAADDRLPQITLEELGLSRDESAEDQAIAKIDGGSFERLVARCRAYTEANPKKHSFDVLKPPPEGGPINGSRTVMGSRIEPDDSLDYFPTPPWATRALMQYALPQLGVRTITSAHEPACGEGHIAEVLAEYADVVIATDIHDYGYGQIFDFLADDLPAGLVADWIVTNPPFKDKTEPFVRRAIERASVGVAMFVRMQWLETKGRYERIFSKTPPTMIAFFAERVPLCKGEWKPEGDTATAYIWLIWIKGKKPQAPFWIPPGCRDELEKPDDTTRFVSRPVMTERRVVHFVDGDFVDVVTGEIVNAPLADTAVPRIENVTPDSSNLLPKRFTPDEIEANGGGMSDEDYLPSFLKRNPDNSIPSQSVVSSPRVVSDLANAGDGG